MKIEERYIVYEDGRIFSILTNRFVKPYINNKGYKIVDLHFNGARIKKLVHRLVAEKFVPNPNNLPIVLHLDSNPLNCNSNNLKWGTYSENNKQAVSEGHMIVPKPDNRKKYIVYNDTNYIICNGNKEVLKECDISESMFRNYVFRKTKITRGKYKGYKIKLL